MFKAPWRAAARKAQPPAAPAAAGRVSVVVPLYNHARYVADAVRSALDQGPVLREVVVVDDGSTDNSAEALLAACGDDPRLVLWSQPNRGAHAAINAGLLRATGEVLAVLNSDDVYAPGRLDRLVAALDADPGADLAATGLRFLDGDGAPAENLWYEESLAFHRASGDLGAALVNGNFLMTTSNLAFRCGLLDRIGLLAPLRYAHDLDFLLRALAHGRRFTLLLDEPLLFYRVHAANTIKEEHGAVRLEWAAAAAAFLDALTTAPGPVDWARLRAVGAVLERHKLLPAVQLCLAHLRRHPAGGTLERAPMLADEGFRAALRESV
jgi:glycosyltransferase involved in cell wall biosynthesis